MFCIRADANMILGSGHVMRCLTIAKALKRKGMDTTFLTADNQAAELINNLGFSYISLNTDWDNLEHETDIVINLIRERNISMILIDSYYATEKYLDELSKITKVVYMDDMDKFIYPVTALINYNIYSGKLGLEERYSKDTKLILGCRYVPLREEFTNKKRINNEFVRNILITAGGADAYNCSGQILQYIRKWRDLDSLKLNIVIGPLNQNKEMLEELSVQYSNVILHYNVTNMSVLMQDNDIAISAGGSTLYELCACGIPSISFSYADNQKEGTMEFDHQGFIFYGGDFRENAELVLNNIITRLQKLSGDTLLREELSTKMLGLVDGYGSDRIAEELLTL